MSTAVLISGETRTFAACVANQNWMVYRKLEDPYFFCCVADDEQAKDIHLLEGYFPKDRIFIEKVTQPDELPEVSWVLSKHAPYAPTPDKPETARSILRQLWFYQRVFGMTKPGVFTERFFDCFVRIRPDLFFHQFEFPWKPLSRQFLGPWKATCGGVNDRVSIMGSAAAEAYFNAYDKLQRLLDNGCPLHPESIQRAVLEDSGCTISNTLLVEATALRLPGKGDHVPFMEYPGELAAFMQATR